MLIDHVSLVEIEDALKSIEDLKFPGVDEYNSKFFKASWNIVKNDVVRVVIDFFEKGIMDKRWNKILVTLLPKHAAAKSIKEYRPISCCTIVYKSFLK